MVDQLNQEEVDKKKDDEEERKTLKEKHQAFKDEMAQAIFVLKDEIDTVLQNPNLIT